MSAELQRECTDPDAEDLPDVAVRSRSTWGRRIHRVGADGRAACPEGERDDAAFKACDPARLLAFERFELCRYAECFGGDRGG